MALHEHPAGAPHDAERPAARPLVRPEEDLHLFQTLINQSIDAILIADPESGRVLYANDRACADLGYTRQELLARRISDVALNVRDRGSWKRLVKRARSHGYALIQTEQKRKDGTRFPVDMNVRHVVHDGAEYLVSIARDITERRRAEDALEKEKNKLEAVLAAMGDGFTVQDRDFRVLYQNSINRGMFGDRVGERCYAAYHGRDTVCDGCLLERSFRDGSVHRREMSVITGDGTAHREVIASPVRDARGSIFAGIEVVRDITERKRLEGQLVHAQRLEAVGQLAGGVAHDFNNILTAILGFGEMLQSKLGPADPLQKDVQRILTSTDRAAHLTRSLLAFSRRQVIRIRPMDLNSIVRRMDDLLRSLMGSHIELVLDLADHELAVLADTAQFEQILMNLATNARDAMPAGGRFEVRTEQVELDDRFRKTYGYGAPGIYAVLTASDTGSGMDDRTRASVFEPFFTTKEVGRGTGLGLSIVYGVVKQHGGYITVRSAPGQGTSFTIYLPVVSGTAAAEERPADAPEVTAAAGGTVLLAEDNAEVRQLVRDSLTRKGYSVIEASDGEEAVARFNERSSDIDLVVLDVVMPKRSGRDALEEIRRTRRDVKALFMSGYTADILQQRRPAGADVPFLPKPFSSSTLVRAVSDALAGRRPQDD